MMDGGARPDARAGLAQTAILGVQHALAMDVYVVPFLVGVLLGLPAAITSGLIGAGFIAAGLATLVQSQVCLRMPVVQGPSYVPIGAVVAIAHDAGIGAGGSPLAALGHVFGALIPGALLMILLGWPLRLFHRIVSRLVPPLVGGAIIVVVGITLMPAGLQGDVLGGDHAALGSSILLALAAGAIVVVASLAGVALGSRGRWLRVGSVLLALAGGSLLAACDGRLDLSGVAAAPWIAPPLLAGLDVPLEFSPNAILTMLAVYAVVLAETTGTWLAVAAVTGERLRPEQYDRGAAGEGLGCLVSALLCSLPVTGYASNAGIVALTGVAERRVFAAAGIALVCFGLCGKLAAAIAAVPAPVIGGVFGVLCVVIVMNGLRILAALRLDERDMMVAGLPILLGLGAALLPQDYLATLPRLARCLLGSATAVGAAAAIALNLILPRRRTIRG
nr:solute carrier family 23 protein [uncultured Lichenicoccus sp.]